MAVPRWLQHFLARYEIPYEVAHHASTHSASRLAQTTHLTGYRVAKSVLVSADSRPVMAVLPAARRLDLERLKAVLGGRDVRLAKEEEVASWFKDCEPGSVPPLRLRADQRIVMDRALAHLGRILCAAGTAEDAISVRFRDWYRAVRPGVARLSAPANGHSEFTPPQILVVEDEAETNRLLCWLLNRQGFSCQGAEEGRQALVMAAQMRPAAILLDLMLPDMPGYEVYEQLRRIGPLKRIPFLVISALDDEASRQRGRRLGAEGYLTKPFLPDTLVSAVQGMLADAQV
jgi:Ala-tRNA(Pro) deacylase